jgi:GTP cyclohydrolase I
MVEKIKIALDDFENLVHHFCARIDKTKFKYVYGVPRGGILLAQAVAAKTGLKQVDTLDGINPKNVLIVDDLIDSGKTKEKYSNYTFEVLINKQTDSKYKGKWIEFFYEKTEQDDTDLIIRMLERIGEDPKREGLADTPKRVIKMWNELFRGYDSNHKPNITTFENGKDGIKYDEMIVDTGTFVSHCEHHMVPFYGRYVFAYIPSKKIIGLSKVARLVDYYSARLQVQERLTSQIVEELEKEIKPKGIALYMEAEHMCKTMRGVKKRGLMKTNCVRGVFRTKPEARSEFMKMINGGN